MKASLRKEILQRRSQLSQKQVEEYSNEITNKLISNDIFINSNCIMTYVDFRKEVITSSIIECAISLRKKVVVPVCIMETNEIVAAKIENLDELVKNSLGIREPLNNKIFITDRNQIDLVIVPGAVFDIYGNRIGYGAGYYDKFLSSLKQSIVKIAVAYSFQIASLVPYEEYDIPMDYIITETELIDCKQNRTIENKR